MRHDLTVLVVGSGAREHALYWAIGMSPLVERVFCTPGNGGIDLAYRGNVKESDIPGLVQLAKSVSADLVVLGPEAPLVAGAADAFREAGIRAFGPNAKAAKLEASKSFTKQFCLEAGITTARGRWTESPYNACHMIRTWGSLPVIKADGLCGGKGVVLPDTEQETINAACEMLEKKPPYGEAGSRVVIEDRLDGRECSVMALCDGENAVLLPPARDYKRALDGDDGKNTGGMGAYSPLPDVSDALLADIKTRIIEPTLRGMAKRGTPFHGLLYAGLMLTKNGPYLLEYNVRFGDPETQVVLPRIKSDIVEYMLATLESGGLSKLGPLEVSSKIAVCTVLASNGYPDKYHTGFPITNLDEAESWATLFHAGTNRTPELVSSGGRVMSCVGLGASLEEARERSRLAAETVQFENKFYRKDIAANA